MAVTEEEKQLREALRASELTAADEERRRLLRARPLLHAERPRWLLAAGGTQNSHVESRFVAPCSVNAAKGASCPSAAAATPP